MDGFFVAKFQKIAATPANAVLVDRTDSGKSAAASRKAANGGDSEIVDKTPITDDESKEDGENDDFGGFDEEADEEIIEKGKRNAMRRRGLDPHVLNKNKKDAKAEVEAPKADKAKTEKPKKDKKSKGGEKLKKEESSSEVETPKKDKTSSTEKPKAKGKAKGKKKEATK